MGFDLSRGFRKKFATFFLIFATRPLLSLVAGPALSLPSPRNRFATLCGGYWDSCILWVSVRFVSVSTVLGGFRCQGSPLDCNHYTTLCGICQDLFSRFLTFLWGIVSRIIPYYFNLWGTGSHLYPANANTLRSDYQTKDLLALMGTHTCGRLVLPFCTSIVSHFKGFVKREFFFLRTFFTRCTSSPIMVSLVGTSLLTLLV